MCFSQRKIPVYMSIRPVFRRWQLLLLSRFEEVVFRCYFLWCFSLIAYNYFRVTLCWTGTVFAENASVWLWLLKSKVSCNPMKTETHNWRTQLLGDLEVFIFEWLKVLVVCMLICLRLTFAPDGLFSGFHNNMSRINFIPSPLIVFTIDSKAIPWLCWNRKFIAAANL